MTTKKGGMLVAAPERWDEACFAVPALRAMISAGLEVGVFCRETQQEFWETIGGLAVLPFPEGSKPKIAAAKIVGDWEVSLAWEVGTAAEAFKIAGISKRIGHEEKALKKLLTHPLAFSPGPLEHRVRFYLSAVEALGMVTVKPEFYAPTALGIKPVAGAVLLCPGSDFGPNHEWPIDRWVEIAKRLIASGCRITVASVGGGRELGQKLAANLGKSGELFHASPLAGTLPVLAVQNLVIAADGSLPHLAAHAGATCVTLFGPNDPAWKRPLGRRHVVIRRHVECAPCLMAKCLMDMRCQDELSVERVWEALQAKLGERARSRTTA